MTFQFVGHITKTKQKETYAETIGHDKVTGTYLLKYFNIVANLLLMKLFKMFSGKFIKEKLSTVPYMALYYAQCKHA